MNIYKNFFLSLNFIFLTIFVSNLAYSTCVSEPEFINVKSGIYDLGEVNPQEVFVKSSLSSHALTINFVFNNSELSCYNESGDFVTFQLINGGDFIEGVKLVETFENGNELTTFKFTYNFGYTISNTLNSTYKINSDVSKIVFKEDITEPILTSPKFGNSYYIKSGENFSFDYIVDDSQSGPRKITIRGGRSTVIYDYVTKELNGEIVESKPTSYSDTPSSSKIYTVQIEDRLGNSESKTINVEVDSEAPDIVEIQKSQSYRQSDQVSTINFITILEDDSFELGLVPTISIDISNINFDVKKIYGTCNQNDVSENQYKCTFEEIDILEITNTDDVNIFFTVTDGVGNSKNETQSVEVSIDTSNPVITEFNVYNSLGIKNKVSIFDKNITVKLVATDENLIKPILIAEDFGVIQFAPKQECGYQSSSITLICTWKLGDYINAYSGFNELKTANFTVKVTDKYGNSAKESVIITFDSDFPTLVKDIEIRSNNDVKTGVLKSGDPIDFRITLNDKNMKTTDGEYFVYANLYNLTYDEEDRWIEGRCSMDINTTCDFLNIELNNGYFLKNITFFVSDIMGNKNKFDFEVEVFAVSEEVSDSFSIDQLDVLNPISRERMLDQSVKIWFEGNITNNEESKDIKIVNYQFLNCNESDFGNLTSIDGREGFYPTSPDDIKYYLEDGDDEFILKLELMDHPSRIDLVETIVSCRMSVLKRDNVSIFPEEIVDFNINITFFNSKRGGLIQAFAEDIISDVNDADKLGENFDKIYDVYETVSSVCKTVGSATKLISGVSSAWTLASIVLHSSGPPGKAIAYPVDKGVYTVDKSLSILNTGFIGTMCDMVTCKNGGILTELGSGFGGEAGLGEWLDDLNKYTSKVCEVEDN
jgi:hypothetical protein